MAGKPENIRIADLAKPRLGGAVRDMMRTAVELSGAVDLDADTLLAAASEQTGLDDFGDPSFREPLDLLLGAIEESAGLSPFGRLGIGALLTQLAKNRLLVEDTIRSYPEILDVEIRAPIVIAGLQRTGTTHLHSLLSADSQLRHLPYWESLEPVLGESERAEAGERDPRQERCAMALSFQEQVMPHFRCMHEMTVEHAHEEIQLLAIDFSTMLFDAMMYLPGWRRAYRQRDQTPHYRYLERVLKVLTWLRGGRRWVLKSPQHIEQIGPLLEVFPDATVIFTHRDPLSVVASTATMVCYGMRMSRDEIDVPRVAQIWVENTEQMLRACLRDRQQVPEARSLDVLFHDYMRDDMAVVGDIYARAQQPLEAPSIAEIDAYRTAHPRGRFGRVDYRLDDLGLRAGDLRERFRFYTEHFAVEPETAAIS